MNENCCKCGADSYDFIASCGHYFHLDCIKPWFDKNKKCPTCRKKVKDINARKPLPEPCQVCKEGPSDFLTRCHHFFHKGKCLNFGHTPYGRCPVCNIRITTLQKEEMIRSRFKWTNEDLETVCPYSQAQIAILACESEIFFKKVSLEFVINKLRAEDENFDINFINCNRSKEPLNAFACNSKNIPAIKELVRLGIEVNPRYFYPSAMAVAISNNDLELLNFLIDNGADPLKYPEAPILALSSLNTDNPVVFERLIELGLDPHQLLAGDRYLLICATGHNLYNAVVKLVDQYGLNVNFKTDNGFTAIYLAAGARDMRIIDFLLERGAKINVKTKFGDTPFGFACRSKNFKVARKVYELTKPDVNAHDYNGITPLIYAIKEGDTEFIEFLLNLGANVNISSELGIHPISFALQHNRLEIIPKLIERGCNLNKLSFGAKRLPIHEAFIMGDSSIVAPILEKLIELGADVNARTINNETILHIAARYSSDTKLIEYILSLEGIKVNARNSEGHLPIDLTDNEQIIALLLKNGSKPKRNHQWYQRFTCWISDE